MDVDEKRSRLKLAMCYQSRVKQNYLNTMHSKPTFSVKPRQKAFPFLFSLFAPQSRTCLLATV